MPKALIVNSGKGGPPGCSANQSKRHLLNYVRLVNNQACMLLPFPCTSSKVNMELHLPDSLQMSCRSARHTCRGCSETRTLTRLGYFPRCGHRVCGIIPARLIWSRSFISAPAAAAKINQRGFLHSVRSASVAATSPLALFPFIRTWPGRWRCDYTRFPPPPLASSSRAWRRGQMHYPDLC